MLVSDQRGDGTGTEFEPGNAKTKERDRRGDLKRGLVGTSRTVCGYLHKKTGRTERSPKEKGEATSPMSATKNIVIRSKTLLYLTEI